jgi:sporulation-control protein
MSFFKKALRQIGIGATQVDTQLEEDVLVPGQPVRGIVYIEGGNQDEKLDALHLHLNAQVLTDDEEHAVVHLEKYPIAYDVDVQAGEKLEIDFEIPIPPDVPMTIGPVRVWIQTGTETAYLADPSDSDEVRVEPHPVVGAFMQQLEEMGLRLAHSEFEKPHPQMPARLPFVQELDFKPTGFGRLRIEEVELIAIPDHEGAHFFIEFDRRESWLEQALDFELADRMVHLRITHEQAQDQQALREHVRQLLASYMD